MASAKFMGIASNEVCVSTMNEHMICQRHHTPLKGAAVRLSGIQWPMWRHAHPWAITSCRWQRWRYGRRNWQWHCAETKMFSGQDSVMPLHHSSHAWTATSPLETKLQRTHQRPVCIHVRLQLVDLLLQVEIDCRLCIASGDLNAHS